MTELPDEPWQKVGTDLIHLDGKNYLLVIDNISNYPEMALLPTISAICVKRHIKYLPDGEFLRLSTVTMGPVAAARSSRVFQRSMIFNM